jgi:type III pantothenate kinase
MQLILDLGNTNQKIALFDGGKLRWVETYEDITPSLIREINDENPGIDACILSSVVEVPAVLLSFLNKKFRFVQLDAYTPIPILNHYKTPETLGKDRLAAAVAGFNQFSGQAVLIVNAGTALTYDLVSEDGEYLGGSISPGMNMRFNALHTFTRQLPLLSYSEIDFLVGNTTDGSVLSGVINGVTAEIEGMTSGYLKEHPGLKIILSGGDLNYFVNRLKISIFAFPNIVIYGLQQILAFNDKKPL